MTPTTETTAAQLLEAQAELQKQMAFRRDVLTERIAEATAELALLDGKPAPKVKQKPGPKVGSRRTPKTAFPKLEAALEAHRGTAPQMPLPAMEPNAAQGGE